jgi:hypothetical protein
LGDANTKFFSYHGKLQKKRNFISSLQAEDLVHVTHEDKENVVYQHFIKHIGTYVPRICNLNFANLGWQPKPLSHLENSVTEEELHSMIAHAPKEKALGPDGFI